MFQKNFQNGTFFDLFDPKTPAEKTKNLYSLEKVQGNYKIFDKQTKSNIFIFANPNARIAFPKSQDNQLYLTQQFLNIQIYFIPELSWSIQLGISDQNKIKRRVIFSNNIKKVERKPFYIKYPCAQIEYGTWLNFTVDLYSFMQPFQGQTYRTLDSISIKGFFKLKRIFTTKSLNSGIYQITQAKQEFLPKNFLYSSDVPHTNIFINFDRYMLEPTYISEKKIMESNKKDTIKKQLKLPSIEKKTHNRQNSKFTITRKLPNVDWDNLYKQKRHILKISNNVQNDGYQNKKKHEKLQPISKSEVINAKRPALTEFKNTQIKLRPNRRLYKSIQKKSKPVRYNGNSDQKRVNLKDMLTQRTAVTREDPNQNSNSNFLNNYSNSSKKNQSNEDQQRSQYVQKIKKFSSLRESAYMEHSDLLSPLDQRLEQQIQQNIQSSSSITFNDQKKTNVQNQDQRNYANYLEVPLNPRKGNQPCQNIEQNNSFEASKTKAMDPIHLELCQYEGFGQKAIQNYMQQLDRPYSPPLGDYDNAQESIIKNSENKADEHHQLELIYDPVLQCYYDCKTHTYYELRK